MNSKLSIDRIKSTPFFFIIGRPRSGTTLLRTLFDAHPNVSIPIESPLIMANYVKYNKIENWTKEDILSFYNDVLKTRKFDKWTIDRDKLKTELLNCDGKVSYFDLCKIVYVNYISFYEKKEIGLIGDKNPLYSIKVDRLLKLFPDAKYLHITRDYRDHILSMKRTQLFNSAIHILAYRWKYSAKMIFKLKNKFPNSIYTIRYEDLVENTAEELKTICKFLNIKYESSVLDFHKIKDKIMKVYENDEGMQRFHGNLYEPIDPKRLYLWKNKMTEKDIKIADMVIGKFAEKSGYERKYKNLDFFLFLKLIPGLFYQRLIYFQTYLLKKMPYFIRKRFRK